MYPISCCSAQLSLVSNYKTFLQVFLNIILSGNIGEEIANTLVECPVLQYAPHLEHLRAIELVAGAFLVRCRLSNVEVNSLGNRTYEGSQPHASGCYSSENAIQKRCIVNHRFLAVARRHYTLIGVLVFLIGRFEQVL